MGGKNAELNEQLTRLVWLFHRYYHQNHMQHGPMGDPQRGQGKILAILKKQPEISQKDLSDMLDMRLQSLGDFLSKLEKKGYIARTPSEADRRVMNIRLTKEGSEAAEQEFSYEKIFDCLNAEEQGNLSEYFKRIIETFISELGEEDREPNFGSHGPHGPHGPHGH
jgi:DNA-binding MarR family transcriptional regulator